MYKKERKWGVNWRRDKLKKSEYWCVFSVYADFVRIGYKRWIDIEEKYRKNNKKSVRIVVLDEKDICKGFDNGFKDYFVCFCGVEVCLKFGCENAHSPEMIVVNDKGIEIKE